MRCMDCLLHTQDCSTATCPSLLLANLLIGGSLPSWPKSCSLSLLFSIAFVRDYGYLLYVTLFPLTISHWWGSLSVLSALHRTSYLAVAQWMLECRTGSVEQQTVFTVFKSHFKNCKSQEWWCMLGILGLREAETGRLRVSLPPGQFYQDAISKNKKGCGCSSVVEHPWVPSSVLHQ